MPYSVVASYIWRIYFVQGYVQFTYKTFLKSLISSQGTPVSTVFHKTMLRVVFSDSLHKWMIWGYYTSPLMYAQTAISTNEFLSGAWKYVSIHFGEGKFFLPKFQALRF